MNSVNLLKENPVKKFTLQYLLSDHLFLSEVQKGSDGVEGKISLLIVGISSNLSPCLHSLQTIPSSSFKVGNLQPAPSCSLACFNATFISDKLSLTTCPVHSFPFQVCPVEHLSHSTPLRRSIIIWSRSINCLEKEFKGKKMILAKNTPVSYTHLTLPTILLV